MEQYKSKEEWCEAVYQEVKKMTESEEWAQEIKERLLKDNSFKWGQNPEHLAEWLTM